MPRRSRDKEVLALHEELESMAEELEVAEGQLEAGSAEKQAALQVGAGRAALPPRPVPAPLARPAKETCTGARITSHMHACQCVVWR